MAPNAKKLTEVELQDALQKLHDWSVDDGRLYKAFEFDDFSQALAWMVRVGIEAEKLDHHPDWSNSWNKVDVHLQTHSIGALSQLDVALAERMNELAR
ncbi:MAG: 4a-hydroxytetrahydrobiopterin dehydratase [Chloroflexota bacterium]